MNPFHWIQTSPRIWTLPGNMGNAWETLYDGWMANVVVYGYVTKLGQYPSADEAKRAVEQYWRAAWAMKP